MDPKATPVQKAIYCTRPCCLVAGFTAGYVAKKAPVGSRAHKIAAIYCASSWSTYAFLLQYDENKTIIK